MLKPYDISKVNSTLDGLDSVKAVCHGMCLFVQQG